jgi:hypothetical protein
MCALILVFALQRQSDIVTYLLAVILVSVVSRPCAILNNSVARYLGAISYSSTFAMATRATVVWGWVTGGAFFHNSIVVFIAQLVLALAVASILHFRSSGHS